MTATKETKQPQTATDLAKSIEAILTGEHELSKEQAPWMRNINETERLQSRINDARKAMRELLEETNP